MKLIKLLPLIGIGIFIYLVYGIGVQNIINVFKNVRYGYLSLVVILALVIAILQTYKWSMILKKQGINLKLYFLFKVQLISALYGAITPGRVGSLIKVNYIKNKTGKNLGESSSSVVLERLIDLFVVSLFALFGAFLLINYFFNLFWELLILVFILFLAVIFIFFKRERTRFFLKFFHKHLVPKKYKEQASKLFHSFYDGLVHPKHLIKPFLISLLIWFLLFSQAYLSALALSINNVPFYYFFGLFPLGSIVGLIPVTIAGMGTKEASLIGLFAIVGYSMADKIMAITLLWSFSGLYLNILALYYIFRKHG